MPTFLFKDIIYGPVNSRRFGISLGVNLLPTDEKICNFNCIYCECGWTLNKSFKTTQFLSADLIEKALQDRLCEMKGKNQLLDVITFAGNGEPTLHPDFNNIIDITIRLRNLYYSSTKITVLTNATRLKYPGVIEALIKVENPILKLDAGSDNLFNEINRPVEKLKINEIVDTLCSFNGKIIIQTLFLRGNFNGKIIDNTTAYEVNLWLNHISKIKPLKVMIYPIDRTTPLSGLEKISVEKLNEIANKVSTLGFEVKVVS